ncbi:MAG TPA: aminotransferase class V-fold PLP-dependent enzyme [Gemmatimonadales bacterium]
MSDRRSFLRRAATLGGAAALGDLAAARALFASHVRQMSTVAKTGAQRDEYLLDPDVLYFNHASIGTIPRAVHEARVRYLDLCERNPWLYMWGGAWEEPREAVRRKAADYVGCDAPELSFTHNTTEAFNLLAQGLPLGAGDEVVFSTLNHPGASICWEHHAAARGYRVRRFTFPIADIPHMTADDLLDVYDRHIRPGTRVLVFPHVDNIVGLRYPVRRLTALARAKGVEYIAVDGAQSIGMIPVNMHAMGVDCYAGSPHKWLQAPKGLGVLYVAAGARDAVRPMWVTWGQERWANTGRIFEDYGTRNLAEVLSLGDAIEYQVRLGDEAKERTYRTLWERARAIVTASPQLVWRSPREWSLGSSLFAVETRGVRSGVVFDRLHREQGIVFRAFDSADMNTARLSPNAFNTAADVERVLGAMASLAG